MARAAHTCSLYYTGTTTAVLGESCQVVAGTGGLVFEITDAAKRILDPVVAPIVYDGGVPVAVGVNYLFGRFTFAVAPGAPVTCDVAYLPRHELTETTEFSVSLAADVVDTTTLDSASGFKTRAHTLLDCSGSFSALDVGLTDFGGGTLSAWLTNGSSKVIEMNLVDEIVRAWAVMESVEPSGSVDGLVELSLSWQLDAQLSGTVAFGFVAA